jgi:hypothetical protein
MEDEIDKIFKESKEIYAEWIESNNYPSLSEFIQSAVILVRKCDNEFVAYFPNEQKDGLDEIKKHFILPSNKFPTSQKIFELCESQFEVQMWGLKILKDLNKLNKKEITLNEFFEQNPEIKKDNDFKN